MIYEAVGHPIDRYDRTEESTFRCSDLLRMQRWVADYLKEDRRKVTVYRVELGHLRMSGQWRGRHRTKVITVVSGESWPAPRQPIPSWKGA